MRLPFSLNTGKVFRICLPQRLNIFPFNACDFPPMHSNIDVACKNKIATSTQDTETMKHYTV